MQDDLTNLIVRVEAGTAEQQRELLEESASTIWDRYRHIGDIAFGEWFERWSKLNHKFEASAFVDAALMMVPEFLAWHISSACPRDACATIESGDDRVQDFKGRASTPALALTAAILRARRDA